MSLKNSTQEKESKSNRRRSTRTKALGLLNRSFRGLQNKLRDRQYSSFSSLAEVDPNSASSQAPLSHTQPNNNFNGHSGSGSSQNGWTRKNSKIAKKMRQQRRLMTQRHSSNASSVSKLSISGIEGENPQNYPEIRRESRNKDDASDQEDNGFYDDGFSAEKFKQVWEEIDNLSQLNELAVRGVVGKQILEEAGKSKKTRDLLSAFPIYSKLSPVEDDVDKSEEESSSQNKRVLSKVTSKNLRRRLTQTLTMRRKGKQKRKTIGTKLKRKSKFNRQLTRFDSERTNNFSSKTFISQFDSAHNASKPDSETLANRWVGLNTFFLGQNLFNEEQEDPEMSEHETDINDTKQTMLTTVGSTLNVATETLKGVVSDKVNVYGSKHGERIMAARSKVKRRGKPSKNKSRVKRSESDSDTENE